LRAALGEAGIGTGVHYPLPSHLQPACADLGLGQGALPVTEALAARILSLPMYPELPIEQVERVAQTVSRLAGEVSAAHA
jgi:dTDP-4-amino-4,6-dideoxygalactose transaminase